MTAFIENIRKMMGWCPNTSALDTKKSVQFEDMIANAPDGGRELNYITISWWKKYHNRILLNSFIITLITGYFIWGIYNMESLVRGLLFWLIVIPVTETFEWYRLNKAATGELKKIHAGRRNKFVNLPIFGFMIAGILIIGILITNNDIKFRNVYAIILGFIVVSWAQYLEIIYWEHKYKKILIMEKTSFYAVDALDIKTDGINESD